MLTNKISNFFRVAKNYQGVACFHTITSSESAITKGNDAITVYESPEFNMYKPISNQEKWPRQIRFVDPNKKFYQLIPFFLEARVATKYFVLKMEYYPSSKYVKLHALKMGGIVEKYVPLSYIIPITKFDYGCAQWLVFFKQPPFLDLDMVYGNYKNKEMYVFDKDGEWKEEGISHPDLSLENTYNEGNWYDEFNPTTLCT